MSEPRTIPTADVLRRLPYHSPIPSWHSHGQSLVPTDGCASCSELNRRRVHESAPAAGKSDEG